MSEQSLPFDGYTRIFENDEFFVGFKDNGIVEYWRKWGGHGNVKYELNADDPLWHTLCTDLVRALCALKGIGGYGRPH